MKKHCERFDMWTGPAVCAHCKVDFCKDSLEKYYESDNTKRARYERREELYKRRRIVGMVEREFKTDKVLKKPGDALFVSRLQPAALLHSRHFIILPVKGEEHNPISGSEPVKSKPTKRSVRKQRTTLDRTRQYRTDFRKG